MPINLRGGMEMQSRKRNENLFFEFVRLLADDGGNARERGEKKVAKEPARLQNAESEKSHFICDVR